MNNRIPFAFYPTTKIHEEIINFRLPPAAQKVYSWLIRRIKPGTIQEFDKADFDVYCMAMGRKPFSLQWFTTCFKKLVGTRLVRVIRQYRGYGFKVQVYHPWQLDDWVIDSDRDRETAACADRETPLRDRASNPMSDRIDYKNCDYSNKTFSNSNKKFKKQASNTDSSVPSYRESREETTIQRGDRASNPMSDRSSPISDRNTEEVAAPRVKVQEKRPNSQERNVSYSSRPKPKDTGLKSDLNANTGQVKKESSEQVKAPQVEVKVNNKEWRSHLDQLDELGVKENVTIKNALKSHSTERVERAIALFKQKKRDEYIANPNGYFMQALKEDWAGKNSKKLLDQKSEEAGALFGYWYELAKEFGYCTAEEMRDGVRMVYMRNDWEKFTDVVERGYTLEYLRKVKKRSR